MLGKFNLPVDDRALEIKFKLFTELILGSARILHDDNVEGMKVVGLDREDAVYPGQQRLVVCILEVFDHIIQHPKQHLYFRFCNCFYKEAFVLRKEEEAARKTCTFSGLEDLLDVLLDREGLDDIFWTYLVQLHDPCKLVHLVGHNL